MKVDLQKLYSDFYEAANAEMDRIMVMLERTVNMADEAGADLDEAGALLTNLFIKAAGESITRFVQRQEAK
jgi:hypothetical protein